MNYIMKQAGRPTGKFGRMFAMGMNAGHRPVTEWGLDHVEFHPAAVILDVGCGGGKTINTMAGRATEGKVYGIDISEASVSVATRVNRKLIVTGRVEIVRASVDNLPFPDGMFDLVTAVETCYFWPDMVKNLKEILRVLKRSGSLLLVVEAYRDDAFESRNSRWAKAGNFNYYSIEELREFLSEAGYSHIQIDVVPTRSWLAVTGEKDAE